MDEFSFYHIVNNHSEKAKKRRAIDDVFETVTEAVCVTPYSKPVQKKKSSRKILCNIGYYIAAIATAILGFGVMALFVLIV